MDWFIEKQGSSDFHLTTIPIYRNSCLMRIERTPEFKTWFDKLPEKAKAQIDARLMNIEQHSYFGDHKSLGEDLLELRWKNGRRIYYTLSCKKL